MLLLMLSPQIIPPANTHTHIHTANSLDEMRQVISPWLGSSSLVCAGVLVHLSCQREAAITAVCRQPQSSASASICTSAARASHSRRTQRVHVSTAVFPPPSVQREGGRRGPLLQDPGPGQRPQQEDLQGGRHAHAGQGHHGLQVRLHLCLRAASERKEWGYGGVAVRSNQDALLVPASYADVCFRRPPP